MRFLSSPKQKGPAPWQGPVVPFLSFSLQNSLPDDKFLGDFLFK